MKISEAITKIIERFKEGDLPKAIAIACFPQADVPMNKWSFFNKIIAILCGTGDARGFRQWKQAGRYVKKGAKSFPILAPKFKKQEDEETGEDISVLIGFIPVNVFRVEDTDGEPLDYQMLEVPELPLMKVAEKFGVSIKAIPGNDKYYGYYSPTRKEIALATSEESVFFHELTHAVDTRLRNLKPKLGQQLDREIIAELSACTLGYILGKKIPDSIGNHFEYIERYAKKAKLNVVSACMKYFSCVEAVIAEIMQYNTNDLADDSLVKSTQEGVCQV